MSAMRPDQRRMVEEIRLRCDRCAERLESFGGHRVDAPVSSDLLREAAALIRGYNQVLLVESVLTSDGPLSRRCTAQKFSVHRARRCSVPRASDCIFTMMAVPPARVGADEVRRGR